MPNDFTMLSVMMVMPNSAVKSAMKFNNNLVPSIDFNLGRLLDRYDQEKSGEDSIFSSVISSEIENLFRWKLFVKEDSEWQPLNPAENVPAESSDSKPKGKKR
jgi:hypothetical protein